MASKSLNNSLDESRDGKSIKNPPHFQTLIPMSRIKTIMKSSPEITTINNETLFVVCKATELFIKAFAAEAFDKSNKDANLDYNKVATLVSKEEKFEFLSEIVPFKIKAKEALALIEAENNKNK